MQKLWLCLAIIGLTPAIAFAQITNLEAPQSPKIEVPSETTEVESDELIPMVERYRRSLLRGTTLNNPELKDFFEQPAAPTPEPSPTP